jgi:hypothetical protein
MLCRGSKALVPLDKQRIAHAIEGTRFPPGEGQEYDEEASIVRAADFIGQLGDPNYIRKANALYHENEEVGMNRQLGYESPADIVNRYPQFYWNSVAPHIQTAIRYLNMTSSGRQWMRTFMVMCSALNERSRFPAHKRRPGEQPVCEAIEPLLGALRAV